MFSARFHRRIVIAASPRLLAATILAGAVLLGAGCGKTSGSNPAAAGAPQAFPVQVTVTPSVRIPDATEYLSILKSRRSANINPQVEGQITRIFVKSGDHVTPGTALMQIDPLKQEATLGSQDAARAAQEANVNYAKIQLDRQQRLYDAKVVAKQDLDNAQSTYDAAVQQLKSLSHLVTQQDVELKYYKVAAPMDGIVGDIPVHIGDRVIVSTLLTTVDQPGALEAYIYVPAERGRALRVGLPVELLDDTGAVAASSKITFVAPSVDTDTQTVLAKATIDNPGASAAHCTTVARPRHLGHARGAGNSRACRHAYQRPIFRVSFRQRRQRHRRAPKASEGRRHFRQQLHRA